MLKSDILLITAFAIIHVINSQSVVVTVQDATVTLGEDANIHCSYTISGGSLLGWSWYNSSSDGYIGAVLITSSTTLAPDSRYSVDTSQADIITLIISKTVKSDEGFYSCSVILTNFVSNNDFGRLAVQYLVNPVLISFTTPVTEGDTVEMSCSVEANPSPTYTFLKDGKVQQSVSLSTFTIQSVSRINNGSYECRASNNVGTETSDSRTLQVHYLYKPVLSSFTTPVTEGDTVEMSCSADANPSPMYTFLKDGEVQASGSSSTFTIQSVTRVNNGSSYQCRASNSVGSETSDRRTLKVHFCSVCSSGTSLTIGMFFVGIIVGAFGVIGGLISYTRIKKKTKINKRRPDKRKQDNYIDYTAERPAAVNENQTYQDLQYREEETAYVNVKAGKK